MDEGDSLDKTLVRNLALVDALPDYSSRRERVRDDGYGKKGGTSAIAGRKAETIHATIDGVVYSKRVFFGQRFITVSRRGTERPLVTAWHDEAKAREMAAEAKKLGCDFAAWAKATA